MEAPAEEVNGIAKIYLLWDFEELCGVFSTLEKTRAAAREQISYHKRRHFANKRKGYDVGNIGRDIEFRCPPPRGFKQSDWKHWAVGYETIHDDHTRQTAVEITEAKLDNFQSLLKRIYTMKKRRKK